MIAVKYDSVSMLSTLLKAKGFSATVSATYRPPGEVETETYYSAMVVESDGKRLQTSFEEFGEIPDGIPADTSELYALKEAVLLAIAKKIPTVCTASIPALRMLDMALKGIRVAHWVLEIVRSLETASRNQQIIIYAIKPYKKAISLAKTPFEIKNRGVTTSMAVYQQPQTSLQKNETVTVMPIPGEIFNLFLHLGDGDPDQGLLLMYRRYMSM